MVEPFANSATNTSVEVPDRSAHPRTTGHRPDQRVLPVLLDQVEFEATQNGERGRQGVLEATALLASGLDLRRMRQQEVPVNDRVGACRPRQVENIGGKVLEDSSGKRVIAHVQIGDRGRGLVGIVTSSGDQ